LDKEIEKFINLSGKEKGKRADLLVQVTLKSGDKQVLLLHIEIQSDKDEALAERIHLYWSGLYFQTRQKVVSLVVLADINPNWHPTKAVFEFAGFKTEIEFKTCKLLNLDLNNPNNSGLAYEIARAQIASLKTRNDPKKRYDQKKSLLLNLYKQGYTADDVRSAYGMIDHMMLLGGQLKQQLNHDIEQFEKEITMPYVTSIEEQGIEKGIERGIEKGIEKGETQKAIEIAEKMIKAGNSDEECVDLTGLSLDVIKRLREQLGS